MAKAIVIHVSATTADQADGSAEHPFPTLAAARDALRARRRQGGLGAPVQVLVAPGVYRLSEPLVFTPEDGGTAEAPVTWSGDGGRPLVSGGREITGWQDGTINGRSCWQVTLPEVKAPHIVNRPSDRNGPRPIPLMLGVQQMEKKGNLQ